MHEESPPLLGNPQPKPSGWSPSALTYLVICNFPLACSPIDESLCKTNKIQSELAYLNGSRLLVEALVGLVVAFPFGALADGVGCKPIILLSTVGCQLALAWELVVIALPGIMPVQLVLASPLFNAAGGGGTVQVASNTIPNPIQTRASAFFLVVLASLAGASVGPAISSKLMEIFPPWIPAILGFFALPVGLILLVFILESIPLLKRDELTGPDNHLDSEEQLHSSTTLKSHLFQPLDLFKSSLTIIKSASIIIVLATFLTRVPEQLATSQLFAQYISKGFDWPLVRTGYLLGIIHLVVLSLALPWLSKLLLRRQRPASKDLTLGLMLNLVRSAWITEERGRALLKPPGIWSWLCR
ncbi:hypothetical protein BDV26DRAFT_292153 [Aspergillus bertholletiae]|uniref:Major facilitator superfamily domain-containing protein n=1 Tax=Aspergillus bertholletiae TaxID=1226010 RepID=A0A5N7B9P8_9EURO|nr:hypothetical protein BDV26DRAFT_292153 [Aspergillus bertholletiae]